jgi:surface polysaccharide O-acyltransferase-like enzyme
VAWTLVYVLADGERLDPFSAALKVFTHDLLTAGARYHLYFLLVTMQVYLAFPLLRWLLRKTVGHHLALFLAAFAYQIGLTFAIQHQLFTTGPMAEWLHIASSGLWLPSYLFYVVGGAIAGWHFDRLAAFTRRHVSPARVALVASAGVIAGAGTYFAEVRLGGSQPVAASAVFQPVVVLETLAFGWALLGAGLVWADAGAHHRHLVATGADNSFGIYLAHPLVLQGALMVATVTGALNAVRHAPAALELAALLGVGLPLVYATSWMLTLLIRYTPFSLALTGRRKASTGMASAWQR